MSDYPTLPSGAQAVLIDAAWRQVANIKRPRAGSSDRGGSFAGRAATPLPLDAFPGYRLLGEIHRGGQGVVYKALQESTARHVAIKVLRDGHLLTETDIARFEQEVRILGQLRHANIVRIFDSSAAEGRFYYVMDYIPGLPLDAHIRQSLPSLKSADDIVRLFVKICDAVNAAHLRGIIHRDLKPGNIRVDRAGEPFVLDFGLSKLADHSGSEVTQSGQFVGSIPWAAPEQAEARIDAIDIRTDVYSLGVLLYQMLTSEFPFPMDGSLPQLLSQIVKAAPTPPRTYVANLPLDLETIILKCLQKEPERRYQSAGELARDLNRYLAGEPIEARRDSISYVLAKLLARHRLAAGGAAAFVLVLITGLAVSLTFWREAEAARADAVAKGNIAAKKELEARSSAEHAARESAAALAVAEFLTQMITSVNPYSGGAHDVRVADTLDAAAKRLADGDLADSPALEARVRRVLGNSYGSLGLYEQAHEQLRTSLEISERSAGPDSPAAIETLVELSDTRRELDQFELAEQGVRSALQRAERAGGRDHPSFAVALNMLGCMLYERGELDEAEAMLRDALALHRARYGDEHENVLRSANDLALLLKRRGHYDEAQALLEEATAVRQSERSASPAYAVNLTNLAELYHARGRLSDAEALLERAIPILRAAYGDRHPALATPLASAANLALSRERFAEAEAGFREVLSIEEATLGPHHSDVGRTLYNLALAIFQLGRFDEASELAGRAVELMITARGAEDGSVFEVRQLLSAIHLARHDLPAAVAVQRQVHEAAVQRDGVDSPLAISALGNLGLLLFEQEKWDEAEVIFRDVMERRRKLVGPGQVESWIDMQRLAGCLHERGAWPEADALMRTAIAGFRAGGHISNQANGCNLLAMMMLDQKRFDDAEALSCEALEVGERVLPAEHADLARYRINLARALYRAGQRREGLAELLTAFEALRAAMGEAHSHVRSTRREIAALYEALGETDAAAQWRPAPRPAAPE